MDDYSRNLESYREDPVKFWEKRVEIFKWFKPYHTACDNSDPNFPKWFCGGELNLCYDILDRHVAEGDGDDVIAIFDSHYTKETTKMTYRVLLEEVSKLAGAFYDEANIRPGDHVLIYMPKIPETLITILAVVRLGAVYSMMSGVFHERGMADRIDEFKPKLVVVSSVEIVANKPVNMKDKLDLAMKISAHKPKKCFVLQRKGLEPSEMTADRDIDFVQSKNNALPHDCVPVECNKPLFVMYTSGTTGKPKGLVFSSRAVAASIAKRKSSVQGNKLKKITYNSFNYGWMGGAMLLVYIQPFWNNPYIIHEDVLQNLDASYFYGLISKYKVYTLLWMTSAAKSLMQKDLDGAIAKLYQPFCVQEIQGGGDPGQHKIINWISAIFEVQFTQVYAATETLGLITSPYMEIDATHETEMSSQKPYPEFQVTILRQDGSPADVDEVGRITFKLPLSPEMVSTVYNNSELFKKEYLSKFPGYFDMNDLGKFDANGFLYVYGRADDVFHSTKHQTSFSYLEEVMTSHPDVVDCIVVIKAEEKNRVPTDTLVAFFVMAEGVKTPADIVATDLVTLILEQIGTLIQFQKPYQVDAIPRTSTGKIARGIVKNLVSDIDNKKLDEFSDPVLRSFVKALQNK